MSIEHGEEMEYEEKENEENDIESNEDVKRERCVKREREHYEKSYIEFLRYKMPKLDEFSDFVTDTLKSAGYSIEDRVSVLTKDTKCVILNHLNVYDICRLAMTCKEFSKIVNDERYNDYWKNRFRKSNPLYYYVDNNGYFAYKKIQKTIIWFDAFQYVAIKNSKTSKIHNRQTFHTFVKWKRKDFPKIFKIEIHTEQHSSRLAIISEFKLDVNKELLKEIGYIEDSITYDKLCVELSKYAKINCRSFTEEDLNELKQNNQLNRMNYSKPPKCLIEFNEDFLEKWGFREPTTSQPTTSQITSETTIPLTIPQIPQITSQTITPPTTTCKCRCPQYLTYYNVTTSYYDSLDTFYSSSYINECVGNHINGPLVDPLRLELIKYGLKIKLYDYYH